MAGITVLLWCSCHQEQRYPSKKVPVATVMNKTPCQLISMCTCSNFMHHVLHRLLSAHKCKEYSTLQESPVFPAMLAFTTTPIGTAMEKRKMFKFAPSTLTSSQTSSVRCDDASPMCFVQFVAKKLGAKQILKMQSSSAIHKSFCNIRQTESIRTLQSQLNTTDKIRLRQMVQERQNSSARSHFKS